MAQEIEHKFLAEIKGSLTGYPRKRYEQAYVVTGDPEVRVRRTMNVFDAGVPLAGTYFMAVKSGAGLIREEIEFAIPDADGMGLFQMARRRIKKVRYHINDWEIDIFQGELHGLVVAEIEVAHADIPAPEPPAGIELIADVTHDPAFKNKALFLMDSRTLQQHIERVRNLSAA